MWGARVGAGLGGCAELRQPLRALVTRCMEPLGRRREWGDLGALNAAGYMVGGDMVGVETGVDRPDAAGPP